MKKTDSWEKFFDNKMDKRIFFWTVRGFSATEDGNNERKSEKWLDKIEEAQSKMKERFCAEIRKYGGLWLIQEQTEAKLAVMEIDSIQFRQKLVSMCPSDNK